MKSTGNNFVNYLSAAAVSLVGEEEEAGLNVVFDALLWAFVFAMAELGESFESWQIISLFILRADWILY
jgi:hypothetical protein